jgi:hypothetical protein
MSKTILVVTDNVQDQVNGVVTTFKNLEDQAGRCRRIVLFILIPGSSLILLALVILKLKSPGHTAFQRRLRRYSRIIFTSPQKVR